MCGGGGTFIAVLDVEDAPDTIVLDVDSLVLWGCMTEQRPSTLYAVVSVSMMSLGSWQSFFVQVDFA